MIHTHTHTHTHIYIYIPETWQQRGHQGGTCEAVEEGLVALGLLVVVAEASAFVAYSILYSLSLSLCDFSCVFWGKKWFIDRSRFGKRWW